MAQTFGPAVSEEYSPVVFAVGGGRLPMYTPWLSLSQIQLKYLPCLLPIESSRPFFGGRSPLMWLVWALARRVSEWTRRKILLTLIDEQAQLARAAPGVTPVGSSEVGTPVRELIQLLVLGEPLVDSLQEMMSAEERVECAIQATALIWEPLEQVHYVASDNVKFDYFAMAPWDSGGMFGDSCRCHETMMLQWLMRLLCRHAIMNGLKRTMKANTEIGLGRCLMKNTDSPRLAVTPGEWYASKMIRMIRTDLHQAKMDLPG